MKSREIVYFKYIGYIISISLKNKIEIIVNDK